MARVKFLVYSLAALGLWAAHLFVLSPALSARAVEQAEAFAAAAPLAVAVQVQERRLELQGAALQFASSPQGLSSLQFKGAPTAERVAELHRALSEALPAELHQALWVGVVNDAGSLALRGGEAVALMGAEGAEQEAELDLRALSQAGARGSVADVSGQAHQFFSVPAPSGSAVLVLGAQVADAAMVERASAASGAGGLGLLREGRVVYAAGAQKALLEQTLSDLRPGRPSVLSRGEVSALGPVKLPFLTHAGDQMGGDAPLQVGARQALAATPYEVVAVVSATPFMAALAEYQQVALFGFLGLVLLTFVFLLLLGSRPPKAHSARPTEAQEAPQLPATAPPELSAIASDALPELPPAPEASPDDFQFAPAAPAAPAPPLLGGSDVTPPPFAGGLFDDPPASPFPDDDTGARTAPPPLAPFDFPAHGGPTHSYPPDADPFSMAAAQGGEGDEGGDSPDATRVASVPAELLQQSASSAEPLAPASRVLNFVPPPVAAPVQPLGDEDHFQEVYQQFVQTREQCGEGADGLTYDKFALKLRKNKEQLVSKYACRTVRFQVYVKEGKAALKATPVKD